jgi:hypothetical protein
MPGSGTIFVNSMYKGEWKHATPNKKLIVTAGEVLHVATEIAGVEKLLYARVDGLVEGGEFLLMEVELIEPGVYLNPEVAPDFAKAIKEIAS